MNVAQTITAWLVLTAFAATTACGGAQTTDDADLANNEAASVPEEEAPPPPPPPNDDGTAPDAPAPPDTSPDAPPADPTAPPSGENGQPGTAAGLPDGASAATAGVGGEAGAMGGEGAEPNKAETYVVKASSPAESKIADGTEKLKTGNVFDARQDFSAATELDPQSATAWYNLGYVQWRSGAHEDAIGSLEKAVSINATYSRAVFLLSVVHMRKGNPEAGLAVVDNALRIRPRDAMLLNAKAMLLNGAKRYSDALQVCIKALHRDHDNPETLRILADTYLGLGRRGLAKLAIDEAYTIYTAPPAADKKGPTADKVEGAPVVSATQYDKRIAKGSDGLRGTKAESIGKEFGLAHIFYIYGMMALKKKRYEEARGHFQKSVGYRADYPEAWNNLGITWLVAKKGPEAVDSFHKALGYEADFFEARLNLGNAYRISQEADKAKKAMAEYERAAKARPNHPGPVFNIGILYLENQDLIEDQVKRYDIAVEYFNKYIALRGTPKPNDPVNDYIEEAKNMKKIAIDQVKAAGEAAQLEAENKVRLAEEERKKAEEDRLQAAQEAAQAAANATATDAPPAGGDMLPPGDGGGGVPAPDDGGGAPPAPPPTDNGGVPDAPADGGDAPPPPPGDSPAPPPPGDSPAPPPPGDSPAPPPPGDSPAPPPPDDSPAPPPPDDTPALPAPDDAPPPPPPDGGGDAPPPPPPDGENKDKKKPDSNAPDRPPAPDDDAPPPPPPFDGGDEAPPPPP